MRRVVLVPLMVAVAGVLAACGGGGQESVSSAAPTLIDVPASAVASAPAGAVPMSVQTFAQGLADAVNWYGQTPTATYEDYMASFTPVWLEAALEGVVVSRWPVAELGESVTYPDTVDMPGAQFFVEATVGGAKFCVADSRLLFVPDLTEEEYAQSRDAVVEYKALVGGCEDRVGSAVAGLEPAASVSAVPASPSAVPASPAVSAPASVPAVVPSSPAASPAP